MLAGVLGIILVALRQGSGASYCSIGIIGRPRPSDELPLGTAWPGTTYAERGAPNWVRLVT